MDKIKKILIGIFLLAFCIRAFTLYLYHDTYFASSISIMYGEIARHIAVGQGMVESYDPMSTDYRGYSNYTMSIYNEQLKQNKLIDFEDVPAPENENVRIATTYTSPGYTLLLATTYLLFGQKRYIFIQVLQIVLDSLVIFLIYFIVKRIFNRNDFALLSAFLYSIYIPQVRLSIVVIHDAIMAFFIILPVYLFIEWIFNKKLQYLVLCGLMLGISAYMKATVLLLAVPLCLAYFLNTKNIKNSLKYLIAILFFAFLMLVPWTIYYYHMTGDIMLTPRTGAGVRTWIAIGEYENKWGATIGDDKNDEFMRSQRVNYRLGTPQYDNWFYGKTFEVIKADPVWYVLSIVKRLPFLIFLLPRWDMSYIILIGIINVPIVILSIIGFYLSRKNKNTFYLASIPIYYVIVLSVLHVDLRDLIPVIFSYLIFTSVSLIYIKEKLLRK
jgi:4-amino-4-deoxy-L-arabinose transferase-like glycosyltransferase